MLVSRTRLVLAVVIIASAITVPAAVQGQAEVPDSPATALPAATSNSTCDQMFTIVSYRDYAKSVYARKRVSSRAQRRLARMHFCQHSIQAQKAVKKWHRHFIRLRKKRQMIDSCTPFGQWAIPGYIVMRESGGSATAKNRYSTASGYYQMLDSTFHNVGGPDYPGTHDAAQAPPEIQHCVAHRLWMQYGSSPWALTR